MTMSKSRHLAVVALLLIAAVAAPMSAVSAQEAQQEAQQETALAVEQPHYVEDDVRTSSQNGTTIYHVRGETIRLSPQNIADSNVVAYGIANGDGAGLSYDSEFSDYVLRAEETGTYELYWTVERQVTVTEPANESANESSNETTQTTETRTDRYTATVRVEGGLAMVHQSEESRDQVREDADKWREFNATVQELREDHAGIMVQLGLSGLPSTDDVIQRMVTAYVAFTDPAALLTGNFTGIALMVAMTLGGWLFIATVIGPFAVAMFWAYRRWNTKESIEAAEGSIAERIEAVDKEELKQVLANTDFQAFTEDDHLSDALSDEARNPLQAFTRLYGDTFRPKVAVHNLLHAMDAAGYVAVVDERSVTDGGEDQGDEAPAGVITDAHVAHADDVAVDAETTSLAISWDDDLHDALTPWDEAIDSFDPVEEIDDFGDVSPDGPVDMFDLEDALEATDLDLRKFSDNRAAGSVLRDYFKWVRAHPMTDEQGVPRTGRYGLEQHLDMAYLLRDRFDVPVDGHVRLFEAAVLNYDRGEKAAQTLRDVEEGRYA